MGPSSISLSSNGQRPDASARKPGTTHTHWGRLDGNPRQAGRGKGGDPEHRLDFRLASFSPSEECRVANAEADQHSNKP